LILRVSPSQPRISLRGALGVALMASVQHGAFGLCTEEAGGNSLRDRPSEAGRFFIPNSIWVSARNQGGAGIRAGAFGGAGVPVAGRIAGD
jgi:hypothetical protein